MVMRDVPVRVWITTDAALDNVSSVERVGGDNERAAQADLIRESGWRSAASHPRRLLGQYGWPPLDDVLTVHLATADISFIREILEVGQLLTREILTRSTLSVETRNEQLASLRVGQEALRYWCE